MDYWMNLTKAEKKTAFYNFNEKYKKIIIRPNTEYNEQNIIIKVGKRFWILAIESRYNFITSPKITVKRYERVKKGEKIEKCWAGEVELAFERAEDNPMRHRPDHTIELDRRFFEQFERISEAQRVVRAYADYGVGRGCRETWEKL